MATEGLILLLMVLGVLIWMVNNQASPVLKPVKIETCTLHNWAIGLQGEHWCQTCGHVARINNE